MRGGEAVGGQQGVKASSWQKSPTVAIQIPGGQVSRVERNRGGVSIIRFLELSLSKLPVINRKTLMSSGGQPHLELTRC